MARTFVVPRTCIYEIFVDRFAGPQGEALTWPQTSDSPWRIRCGGHLAGIVSRLDHITAIGVDALYLTPIFRAPSNHKYDVADYRAVDEEFGGDAAFDELVEACRERQIGLVLDGVFNHVGTQHRWFLKACENASAQETEFFCWIEHPHDYECWQSHRNLPELNLDHPVVRSELFDAPDSVVRHWLRRGATGWRLDCANDLGPRLCATIAAIVDQEGCRDGAIGEVMAYAEDFVGPDGLHGVMNYYFRATVLALLRGEIDASQAAANFKRMVRRYHYPALLSSWNMLASHDTPRLATVVPDARARRLAYALAFAYPGVPMIYYGEEIGMTGGADPDNRAPMTWDESRWDHETLTWLRRLAAIRKGSTALRLGGYEALPQPAHPSILAFARTTDDPLETIVILANACDRAVSGKFFLPLRSMFDSLLLSDALDPNRGVRVESGAVTMALDPYDVLFLSPVDFKKPRYSFFSGLRNNETK